MSSKVVGCEVCIDDPKSVFSVLDEEERATLKRGSYCETYNKGDVIFKEGVTPSGLICLADGTAKVFKTGVGGREQIVRMAKPNGFIGYRALFADEKHTATAVAIEDSVVCVIEKDVLYEVMKHNSNLSLSIIKAFASELGLTINRTVTLTQKHIRGRLAESLIFLLNTYGAEDDDKTIKAYLSREDLANLSSMTTSNAIRTLTAFQEEKVVEVDGRRIKILDLTRLEKISDLG